VERRNAIILDQGGLDGVGRVLQPQ
jgi:hypothetical protein